MLPLRYLDDDRSLALQILEHWPHDQEHLTETMDRFRISANAVYPFPCGGKIQFLRFAPCVEKSENNWKAELAFQSWLREQGYPCPRNVPSKDGRLMEEISTPNGAYYAVVFERAPGRRLDELEPTEALIRSVGAALGQLHKLSSTYKPLDKPWGFDDVLGWCSQELRKLPDQEGSMWEAVQLQSSMDDAPRSKTCFGVIHHDFEPDNLFVDEEGRISVIDFEDCCMGWYADDLDISVKSVHEWMEDHHSSIPMQEARMAFLNGYRTEYNTPGHIWASLPLFRRYERLNTYARASRVLAEPSGMNPEPDWMLHIRERLEKVVDEISPAYQADAALENVRPMDIEEPEDE